MKSWTYQQYQSNDAYWERKFSYGEKTITRPTDAEVTQRRNAAFALALEMEQRDGRQGFVMAFIVLLLSAAAFLPHWLLARKARPAS